jgi:hypothetical protein
MKNIHSSRNYKIIMFYSKMFGTLFIIEIYENVTNIINIK